MTLPSMSKKRLAAIADGSFKPNPRKPLSRVKAGTPQAARMVRRAFGKAPKSDRAKWMKEADKWFSEFIRLRDSDENGIATCITSGRRAHWREMDCGHYLSRAKMATRYDERNAHAQGKMANRFQGGHFMEHGFRIEEKHGRGTCHALALKAALPCKMLARDFQFLAETYRSRVDRIKEVEPRKYHRAV